MDTWSNKKVLIIDDHEKTRNDLSRIFTSLGMEVVATAENGLKGIDLYNQYQPDFVSFDVVMPEMHGIECFKIIQKQNPELNFMFISCLASEIVQSEKLQKIINPRQVLSKPFSEETIKKVLGFVYNQTAIAPTIETMPEVDLSA